MRFKKCLFLGLVLSNFAYGVDSLEGDLEGINHDSLRTMVASHLVKIPNF